MRDNRQRQFNQVKLILILFIFTSFTSTSLQSQESSNWKLIKNKNGIKVYFRPHKGSKCKETLGITCIKSNLGAIISLIKDTSNHKAWVYAKKKSVLLKTPNDFEWIIYTESEAPWPISNRDMVAHTKMYQDSGSCSIKIKAESVPSYVSEKKGLVRIKEMESEWTFTPIGKDLVEVRFVAWANLEGNLPSWLINMVVDKGPYNTLLNMKKALKNTKYRQARLPYIKEYSD